MSRPDKIVDLMSAIRRSIVQGHYYDTRHATQRQIERNITRPDIIYVLKNGFHEKKKDQFDERFKAWNYAVRGKNIDAREIRVIISFDEDGMLIITAIELKK